MKRMDAFLLEKGFAVALQQRAGSWLGTGLATLAFCYLPVGSHAQQAARSGRDKVIEELQKQIETLNKKLEELRRDTAKPAGTTPPPSLNPDWVKALQWRSIGPACMGGRITALSVYEADPCIYFVATASGGLLKTINDGITFEHQFDHEATVAIGDVCVAPSDPKIVWVGTGEGNPRNSVSYGDGVYKSTDGGKTWKNMGLRQSFQIGRLVIHPKNPDIVYVGALGRLYGPNSERGLYKTTDGGKTWQRILYVHDRTGVIDVKMNPADPETLLVATWERQRDGYDTHPGRPSLPDGYDSYDPVKKWGPGTGLYKTTDGGKTFHKLTAGLPTCLLGRIGIDYYRKNPSTVFAIIDSEQIGMGMPERADGVYLGVAGEDADAGARLKEITRDSPAQKAGLKAGDIILAVDNRPVLSYKQLTDVLQGHKPGDKLAIKIARDRRAKDLTVILGKRPEGQPGQGATASKRPNSFWYGGQRENLQDKQGPQGYQYGGVYKSTDGGETWQRINSANPRPMYFSQIRVDPGDDRYLYVLGIALYRSADGGKTFKPDGGKEVHPDQHALWIDPHDGRHMIVGCDGGFYVTHDRMANWDFLNHLAIGQFYHVALDNQRPYHVYGGLQDNGSWSGPSRTLRNTGPMNEDWIVLGGGDGFVCRVDVNDPDAVYWEFQDGSIFRRNLRTGRSVVVRPQGPPGPDVTINWNKPFLISLGRNLLLPFLPNLVHKEPHRFNWNTPFILSSHNSHIFYSAGNFVFRSLKQGEELRPISPEITRTRVGSATALAESPRNPEVLWVGTDDGNLWVTRDGGGKWTNVSGQVGLPGPRWVASIECSRFAEGRAYVAFDAHRSDDDNPYLYVTEDFGQTWKSLRSNLPWGSSRVLREDVVNPDLLFVGTEFAVWGSINRGASWTKLNNNLPTVAVHELAIHSSASEMVAATHGRSLWVLDITPLRQMKAQAVTAGAYLYQPNTVVRWRTEPERHSPYGVGARHFIGQNPPPGAQLYYSLNKKADRIELKIVDYAGKTVRELKAPAEPGLHRIDWALTRSASGKVAPGMYRVLLTVDGQEQVQSLQIEPDPVVPDAVAAPEMKSDEDDRPDPG
jgi:photosystem II stability/assembly factor-like uncharacterized protein